MNRILFVASFLALVAPLAACGGSPYGEGEKGGGTAPTGSASGAATGGGATCNDACGHYLECKGAETQANLTKCDSACSSLGLSETQLASFVASDCATAIAEVEGTQPNGGNSGGSGSSSCDGCVNDGSGSCVWLSQSDWGAGAYNGAALSCDPSCCGM